MNKKEKFVTLMCIGILIVLLSGISYAYFEFNEVLGNNTNNTVVLELLDYGHVVVTYENDSDSIEATSINLTEANKNNHNKYMLKFDVLNDGDVRQNLFINWYNISNDFCQYTSDKFNCTGEGDYVGDELNYALYSCTTQQYAAITTPNDADISSCTKITAATNPAAPIKEEHIHSFSLEAHNTNYFVIIVTLKNVDGIQNYQLNKTFRGSIKVNYPFVSIGDTEKTFDSVDTLGYKAMSDPQVRKISTPATTTKTTALWVPTENEWKTLVCDENSIWYGSSTCPYCDPTNLSYNPTTCTTRYNNQIALDYVSEENGIFSVTNNNGISYFYRGGEGCSVLGADITSTYNTASTCIAANGNWMALNTSTFKCYANGTPQTCTNAGGTWSYLNNNVSFAGFNWKIVRINEDGSIRIVLDGLTSTVKKTGSTFFAGSNSPYNTNENAGTPSAANEATAIDYASYEGSNLENAIESFYETYIDNSATLNTINYSSYLADSTFCNDTTWYSQEAGSDWDFNSHNRASIGTPTYECPSGSTYKVTNSPGETLTYPIATLSTDEINYAGANRLSNSFPYMQNPLTITDDYWTITPVNWISNGHIKGFRITESGSRANGSLNMYGGVRPVLNLKSYVTATGSGTANDPYVLD